MTQVTQALLGYQIIRESEKRIFNHVCLRCGRYFTSNKPAIHYCNECLLYASILTQHKGFTYPNQYSNGE